MNIYQKELHLSHMTPEEKRIYNKHYYQEHKDYWVEWNKKHPHTPTPYVLRDSTIRPETYTPNIEEDLAERYEKMKKNDRFVQERSHPLT